MSASSFRRLPFLLLVVGLAFPSHASAMSWDFGNLIAKAQGFFSALWGPSGCEMNPDGRCGAAPSPVLRDHGCELDPDGRYASTPVQSRKGDTVNSDVGCEIMPDGRCGA